MRVERFSLVRVRTIPIKLKEGRLYVSKKYKTSCHLCPCGCGRKVVTPIDKGYWSMKIRFFHATLFPSIGNWAFPCKSHYWIIRNKVFWAGSFTDSEIEAMRYRDTHEIQEIYGLNKNTKDTQI